MSKVTIVDYGLGNTKSILNACKNFLNEVVISSDQNIIKNSSHIIIPGVGSFDYGIELLKKSNLKNIIKEHFEDEKPILGICLGLQIFFEKSEEGSKEGLSLIQGDVIKIKKKIKDSQERIPIINWRNVSSDGKSNYSYYFDHSYAVNPKNKNIIKGYYLFDGQEIPSIIEYKNFIGCQFHPEKSGKNVLNLLENFLTK